MGIYDREYYRREGPSLLGGFSNRGQVCKWLIAVNVGVFVVQLMTKNQVHNITDALVLDTDAVSHGQVWRLLTYAFLHSPGGGFFAHILFNMLFLWWFGSDMEDHYGPREFLAFYLVSAVVGGLAFQFAWYAHLVPPGHGAPILDEYGYPVGFEPIAPQCLGASGAVTAVMVLCALHYPTRLIYIWFFFPIPIWLFVLFQVAQDSFMFVGQMPTGTAVTVHLGGAAFGFAYYQMNWRIMGLWNDLRGWQRQRSQPRLRVYREESPRPLASHAPSAPDLDEGLEAKLDAVLEKVARSGQASLTESEKQLLLRASEVFKRRRT
jgi:membrane associated rhomboid family serine protease